MREVETLATKVPIRATPSPDGHGVCLSLHYSFFAARAKFVLHLLISFDDPAAPLAWQLATPEVSASAAPSSSGCTALASSKESLHGAVGSIVDANARGFGRLDAIHAGVTAQFCR